MCALVHIFGHLFFQLKIENQIEPIQLDLVLYDLVWLALERENGLDDILYQSIGSTRLEFIPKLNQTELNQKKKYCYNISVFLYEL